MELIDSVVDVPIGTDLSCTVSGGTPDLRTTRSAFRTIVRESGCTGTASSIKNLTATPPIYRDAAAKDWRPAWNSPLVDAGTTNSPTQTKDLANATRFVDGNGAGGAAVDLGAYEYQRQSPDWPMFTLPTGATAGVALDFSATAADGDGDPLTFAWTFGDGGTATGASPSHTYASAGSYVVKVTVTDPTGLVGTGDSTLVVAAPPTPTPTPTPTAPGQAVPTPTATAGGPVGTAAPTVKLVRAPKGSTKRSKAGFAVTPTAAKTSAQLQAEGATSLRLSLTRLTPGRRSGNTCRAAVKRGARCSVRTAVKGTATATPRTGSFGLTFGGTFAGKRVKAGTYEVRVVPVSAAGTAGTAVVFKVTLR